MDVIKRQNTVRHRASKFAALALVAAAVPMQARAQAPCRERLLAALESDGFAVAEGSDAATEQVVDAALALHRQERADVTFFVGESGWHAVAPFVSHRQMRRMAVAAPDSAEGWCALEQAHANYREARGRRALTFGVVAALGWFVFAAGIWRLRRVQKPKRSEAVQSS